MTKKKINKKRAVPSIASLSVPIGYGLNIQGTTQSLITTFKICRVKWLLQVNRFRNPEKNRTTNLGSLAHDVLARMYVRNTKKFPTAGTIDRYVTLYREENQDRLIGVDEQKLEDDSAIAQVLLTNYIEQFPEDFKLIKFTDAELEFEIDIDGYVIRGKIDGLFLDPQGRLWIMEHKTKGRITVDTMLKKLNFDFQMLVYCLAMQKVKGVYPYGALYNVIRVPQIKPRKHETLETYCERLDADIKSRPEFYFMRWEITFSKQDQRVFERELAETLRDMQSVIDGGTGIYKNEYNCEFPFKCEFLDACASKKLTGLVQRERLFEELDEVEF